MANNTNMYRAQDSTGQWHVYDRRQAQPFVEDPDYFTVPNTEWRLIASTAVHVDTDSGRHQNGALPYDDFPLPHLDPGDPGDPNKAEYDAEMERQNASLPVTEVNENKPF